MNGTAVETSGSMADKKAEIQVADKSLETTEKIPEYSELAWDVNSGADSNEDLVSTYM